MISIVLSLKKRLLKRGSVHRTRNVIKEIIQDMEKRQKCIRMADGSPGAWATVKEYLTDDLASDSDDDRRIKKAEKRALEKNCD